MDASTYKKLYELFYAGKLKVLSRRLAPYLASGDMDARFLNAHFSLDPFPSGEVAISRRKKELEELAGHFHARSLFVVAWHHFQGDDGFEKDHAKFKNYLTAAALLGHDLARRDLCEVLERESNWEGFDEKLEVAIDEDRD